MKNWHALANVYMAFVFGLGIAVFADTGNAQVLTNGGFELGAGLYTNTANTSQVTTGAVGWSQFNHAFRVNSADVVPNPLNSAANTNAVFVGAHGGTYTFQCYGPFSGWDASGAYQVISNGVTSGQTWILSGYGLNWSGDPMTNNVPLAQGWGSIQLVFRNASGTQLGPTLESPTLNSTNPVPVDTWISCTVTGIAPVGTAQVVAYALHVGFGDNTGSIFWDDLSLVHPVAVVQSNSLFATIAVGNQVCWLTTAGRSYQPQFTNSTTGAVWSNLVGEVAGDGNTNCVFDASGKKNFYRILELQ